jgi:putative addiction module component (TIGR02574 family)
MSDIMASLAGLTPAEKLELIGELWDDLSSMSDQIPLTDAQIEELDRRKANFQKDPSSALTWEQVESRIKEKYRI